MSQLHSQISACDDPAFGRQRRTAYETLETLGRGSQATVKLARHKATQALVAIKTISKPDCRSSGSDSDSNNGASSSSALERMAQSYASVLQSVRNEVRILREMEGHPSIPRLYEVFETSSKWYIVMEYIGGPVSWEQKTAPLAFQGLTSFPSQFLQDLDTFLKEQGGKLAEEQSIAIVSSILHALVALHAKGFVHRDLKPANIVIRDAANPADLVIIDFGSSFAVAKAAPAPGQKQSSLNAMQTICGTPYFLSPELVRGAEYDAKVDLWAIGCIAFTLLCGRSPFSDSTSYSDLYTRIMSAGFQFPASSDASVEARLFVSALLDIDVTRRATAGEALAHRWISPPTPTLECAEVFELSGALVEWDAATGSLRCAEGVVGEQLTRQFPLQVAGF